MKISELMVSSGVRFGTSGARGLVADMTDEVCFAYTSAFLSAISVNSGKVALGIDLRPSSPAIAAACAAAIRYAGLTVDFCGAISTPALAYYAQQQLCPAIMVTGSHIPFDRNGIKFYRLEGEITKEDETAISCADVGVPDQLLSIALPEVNVDAYHNYMARYLGFFPKHCLAGMKLGFYEHSSVARDLLRELLKELGADVVSLGRTNEFVPIDTEAVSDSDTQKAHDWATKFKFDAIVSTDGDADRPLVGDEKGDWFRGDAAGILCAQYLDAKVVATTVSCSTAVEKCDAFERVVRTRIGSPYVIGGIDGLIRSGSQAVVGFEPNGGFLVGSSLQKEERVLSPLLTRDAVLPILCLLSMAKERQCKVSELRRYLPERYTASDRLQSFPTEVSSKLIQYLSNSSSAVEELLAGLCGSPIGFDQTDGLRIFLENEEIVHFRPSGNAPELRCYAEAASQERAQHLVRECLGRLSAKID